MNLKSYCCCCCSCDDRDRHHHHYHHRRHRCHQLRLRKHCKAPNSFETGRSLKPCDPLSYPKTWTPKTEGPLAWLWHDVGVPVHWHSGTSAASSAVVHGLRACMQLEDMSSHCPSWALGFVANGFCMLRELLDKIPSQSRHTCSAARLRILCFRPPRACADRSVGLFWQGL